MNHRTDCVVSDSLGGVFPNKVYATLEIRVCRLPSSAPLQGRSIYSNSRVHGNRTLYAEARPYHYKLYIYTCWFRVFFLAGMSREEARRHVLIVITAKYYTMLQQLLLHCYFNSVILTVG